MPTRIRRRRTRDRVEAAPPAALLAYWQRAHVRLRLRMAAGDASRESMRLRREQIDDDEWLVAAGLDWRTRVSA